MATRVSVGSAVPEVEDPEAGLSRWVTARRATPAPTAVEPAPAPGLQPDATLGQGINEKVDESPMPVQQAAPYTTAPPAYAPPAQPLAGGGDIKGTVVQSYLDMARQSRVPDKNDPAIRAQADAFSANQDRQSRNLLADEAERQGPYASGALQGVDRMLKERAGIASGSFEADLVGREIQARREEILMALNGLTGFITEGERQQLQRELANLNASMESARLTQSQTQFSDTLGYNIGRDERMFDNDILRMLINQGQ